jgi:hypothetical protein
VLMLGRLVELGCNSLLGAEDVVAHGGEEFWRWLREVEGDYLSQGGMGGRESRGRRGRREHLQDLQRSLESSGVDVELEVVDGVAHDAAGVRTQMLSFARTHLQRSAQ